MESAIWGLIGTVIGAAASLGTTYLTNRHAAKLQSDSQVLERQEKSRAFQRETLLELQNSLHDAIRLTSLVHLEDAKAHASGSPWGKTYLPNDLAEEVRLSKRRVMLFVERVADDSVRKLIKDVMTDANAIGFTTTREESRSLLDQLTFKSVIALEVIGKTLRALY